MTQPYKQCPQCQTPAPLQAPSCAACGHVYRTQFTPPLDQTQVVSPSGPTPTQQFGVHRSTLPAYGPRDQVEWKTSCFWFWIWLWFSSYLGVCFALLFVHSMPAAVSDRRNEILGGALIFSFACATWATFCATRLRRLYVYYSPITRPWTAYAVLVVLLVAGGGYGFQRVMWPPVTPEVAQESPTHGTDTTMRPTWEYSGGSSGTTGTFSGYPGTALRPPVSMMAPPSQYARPVPTYRTLRTSVSAPPPYAQPTIIEHDQQRPAGNSFPGGGGGFGGGGFDRR